MTKLRSLKHLIYSKDKTVPCIDWHPTKTGVIVACAEDNISFNDRTELAGTARRAHSLIWRMKDLDPCVSGRRRRLSCSNCMWLFVCTHVNSINLAA